MCEVSPSEARSTDDLLREVLSDVLALPPERVASFDAGTELFGALAELDSQAVAALLTEIEDRCDIIIDDEDVDGEMLETYGALLEYVETKRAG